MLSVHAPNYFNASLNPVKFGKATSEDKVSNGIARSTVFEAEEEYLEVSKKEGFGDAALFKMIHKQIHRKDRKPPHMTRQEVMHIATWFWRDDPMRNHLQIFDQDNAEVVKATGEAFEALSKSSPNTVSAIRKLKSLNGMDVPLATAILTAYDPENYTMISGKSLKTLNNLDNQGRSIGVPQTQGMQGDKLDRHIEDHPEIYPDYMKAIRTLRDELELPTKGRSDDISPLRTLDRALWQLNGRTRILK